MTDYGDERDGTGTPHQMQSGAPSGQVASAATEEPSGSGEHPTALAFPGSGQPDLGTTGQPESLAPVLVAVAPSREQSRVTVLLRLILAVPHVVVLYVLGIAAWVVLVIGWFGALFTGQLPQFAADYLTGYLRWQSRVLGYMMLLTDEYPPFELGDTEYPVRIAVRPGSLNRLAVLFRCFLLIPAMLIALVLSYGTFTVVEFVAWLIVLITRRMPGPLHQALAAVLRYLIRFYGYQFMLTSTYPAGLFGDEPHEPQGARPPWLMLTSGRARQLIVASLALGAVVVAAVVTGASVAAAVMSSHVDPSVAANQVETDFAPVSNALFSYQSRAQGCDQQLACLTALDRSVAADLSAFAGRLRSVSMPSSANSAATALDAATSRAAQAFSTLGTATSASQYNSGLVAVQRVLDTLGSSYNKLGSALGAS